MKQNQLLREYKSIKGFELRKGQFYDPNVHFNGIQFEIRVLHHNPEFIDALNELIIQWIKS